HFGWAKPRPVTRRRPSVPAVLLSDLAAGDFVVHVDHGVGRYQGMTRMAVDAVERDYLVLEYASGDRMFVPTDQADRVSKYHGAGEEPPALHRLGTGEWTRAKERVKASTRDIAKELLEIYSARQIAPGHAYPADTPWQAELEGSFPYVETPDQLQAVVEVKIDMENPKPMDRLICGDVGYGKTEVALRAAFKAVNDGKQVAVLVPTTVLAQQHFNTFRERLQAFPVKVEMMSRFRSPREQKQVLAGIAAGSVDVCIGTHRLLQKDVSFKDLGLLVIDEEHRFGVTHKERLKQLRKQVDVLTLSATPIPRTLHMSLAGVRDMSTIATPPEERLPIKTFLSEYRDSTVREAILRELDRGGQVFFVHNRVHDIATIANRVARLVPEAKVAVGHGQMREDQLERTMVDFADGQFDVLVCTTIIESGLDMPNVNTIIVHEAEKYGLAQLYQLRGRVGRSANRAYAYLMFSRNRRLTPIAEKRLRTIFEATDLGAGFQIALKDLEIRGAGNLLGVEQHGHIAAVGFDLYTRLLAEAVEELRGRLPVEKKFAGVSVDLPLPAFLPPEYVADDATRLNLYQRLASVTSEEEVGKLLLEVRDRFGQPSEEVLNLFYLVQLKATAVRVGIQSITAEEQHIVLRLVPEARPDRAELLRRYGRYLGFTPNTVRLDRRRLGGAWQATLQTVVEACAVRPAVTQ
ncbi:MAG: transcription-repair coupling factor, partial [Chloroflexota bacterium]